MRRIYATRPQKQNEGWAQKLAKFDCEIVRAPLLEIRPVAEHQLSRAKNTLLNLDEYKKLIFVSQNAVDYGIELIDEFWPQLPVGLEWFAIGTRTAELLNQRLQQYYGNVSEGAAINTASSAMNSEELLNDKALQAASIRDEKILIFRGLGGRPHLAERLAQRGARVHYCELYERSRPEQTTSLLKKLKINDSDIVPVFSGESLENFVGLMAESNTKGYVEHVSIVVPGERVKNLALTLGFKKVWAAHNATETEMLATIKTIL